MDELPAIAAMAYGARILADHGWPEAVTLYLSASVMEEDCDGYCMLHLIERENIRPDYVVLGEPTDLNVYRGQRGRLEATITTKGRSAHGAHAALGVNALYKMAPIISDVEELNTRLAHDDFLGTGSVIVSFIECTTPSLNAVPDSARITIDRRLTVGETQETALTELRSLPHLGDAEVELLDYDALSWRGHRAQQPKYYPTWVLEERAPAGPGRRRGRRRGSSRTAEDLPLALFHQRCRHHGDPRHPHRRLRPRPRGARPHNPRTRQNRRSRPRPPPSIR